jgi:hypothetical protein
MSTSASKNIATGAIGILLAILPASPVYAKESKTAPSASRTKAEPSIKRKLDYDSARKTNTADAYEAFLKKYPKGADSDDLRSDLPPLIKVRVATALGGLALEMAPSAPVTYVATPFASGINKGVLESRSGKIESPPKLATLMLKFREMLEKGADSTLIRIAGYRPSQLKSVGTSKDGKSMMSMDCGSPGKVVPAEQAGMTLLEYFEAIQLKEACDMLTRPSEKP